MTQASDESVPEIRRRLASLLDDAAAKSVVITDADGDVLVLATCGDCTDASQIAQLAADQLTATDGLASLIGEKEFSVVFHEGESDNLHFSRIDSTYLLAIVFDEKSSLGRVRLVAHKYLAELKRLLGRGGRGTPGRGSSGPDDPDSGDPMGALLPVPR